MIADIAKQCKYLDRTWDAESWKRLLVEDFVDEMRTEARAQGKPDPFAEHGQVVPSLDGKRIVQLGIQTRKFGKKIAAEFIEYLYSYGAQHNVQWSEPKEQS